MATMPRTWTQLDLPPMPPVLERAFGYTRDAARFVLFYWEWAGDELIWSDGQVTTTGTWQAYLLFTRHPRIRPAFIGYEFGSSDTDARDGLVLDRETRLLFVGRLAEAKGFVRAQHGPELTREQWAALEGITLEEARAREQAALREWFTVFTEQQAARYADPAAMQADVAERLRIDEATSALLQAALDALPIHPVSPLNVSVDALIAHRVVCLLCGQQVGAIPQRKDAIVGRIRDHLLGQHPEVAPKFAQATRTVMDAGGIVWQAPDGTALLRAEPPHVWVPAVSNEPDTLETRVRATLVEQCRHHFAGLFDDLALVVLAGASPVAVRRFVASLMPSTTTPMMTGAMLDEVIAHLVRVREQEGGA